MGFGGGGPEITQADPTNPLAAGATGAAGDFFQGVFGGAGDLLGQIQNAGTSGLAGQAGNAIASTLGQNPTGQAQDALTGLLGGIGGLGAGQQVVNALQPIQQRQAQQGLGQIQNSALGIGNTAAAQQGSGFLDQINQGFNAQNAGFLQQGQALDLQAQLGASGLLNTFANDQLGRQIGAGQFGLQQNQASIAPLLQLLGLGTQFAQPQGLDTIAQPNSGGVGSFLGGVLGTGLGSFLGPLGAAAGGQLGSGLFGGGGGPPIVQTDGDFFGAGGSR